MSKQVWLLAAALPLGKFFDKHNFVCNVPDYQRNYEWEKETHTFKLVTDLQQAFIRGQEVMLLGNVILQQTDQKDFQQASSEWHTQGARFCDIVDGQQRITTVVMLYAAIQDILQGSSAAQQSACTQLSTRLGTSKSAPSPFLTTQQDDFGEWFSFSHRSKLDDVLQTHARQRKGRAERSNALYLLNWLKTQVNENSLDPLAFLEYLDKHVHLTVTVTSGKGLAFQTFANINYSGKPLQNQDILKAMLLEDIPDQHQQIERRRLVKKWSEVAKSLDTLQKELADSYRTRAWKYSNGLSSKKKALRGAIELPLTLFDELLEHLRQINDPERQYKGADLLSFYQHHFQIKPRLELQPEAGFQKKPTVFMREYLLPFCSAFTAVISLADNPLAAEPPGSGQHKQYNADMNWSRSVLYHLKCFPTQGWRTAALLAVKLAQEYHGDAKQAAAWLKCFLTELEAISLAALFVLGARADKPRQKTFDAIVQSLLQVDPARLRPEEVIDSVFGPVWQKHFSGSGKVRLLTEINNAFLYKKDGGNWAKAVLMVLEHIIAAGTATGGAGGRGSQWDGTLSIEHILPQDSAADPDWYKAESEGGAGWDAALAEKWVHKLGNLCILNTSQNSANSNRDFQFKKTNLFSAPMDRGIAAGLTAAGLVSIPVWNLAALQERQATFIGGLAKRWGVADAWTGKQSTRGTGTGKNEKDKLPSKASSPMAMEVNGDIADTAGAAPAASSSANTGAVPSALPEGSAHVNKQQSTLSGMPNAMPSPLPEASADVNGEQSTPSSTPSAVPRPDTTAQKCLMLTSGRIRYVLQPDESGWTIGRNDDNTIVLNPEWLHVSRYHCSLMPGPKRNTLRLKDTNSSCGTWLGDRYVNPNRANAVIVKEGQTFYLGGPPPEDQAEEPRSKKVKPESQSEEEAEDLDHEEVTAFTLLYDFPPDEANTE